MDYSKMTDEELKELQRSLKNDVSRLHNLQMAVKILLNSSYGACGNAGFRYFDVRIAEGITISGQLSIRWVANTLNAYLDKVIGESKDRVVLIDTDSVVLTLDDLVQKVYGVNKLVSIPTEKVIDFMDRVAEERIQPVINRTYEDLAAYMNAYEQKMFMKRENLADTMISVSKKRYVMSVYDSEGVRYKEPQLKIMGLQMVKSSTPAVIRDKLKESLKAILYGSEKDVHKFVSDFKSDFMKFAPEEIAFPRGVNNLEKYANSSGTREVSVHWGGMPKVHSSIYVKGTPIHVRGALLFNHYLKHYEVDNKYQSIQDGDKIKFLYLKTPNTIQEDCIAFIDKLPPEFNLNEYVDYDKMYEKTFIDAVQNILDAMGWNCEPQPTLDDFFSWS